MSLGTAFEHAWKAWNRFWFRPYSAHTLAAIRIATGLMLAYVHAIWLYDITAFMGPDAWIDGETIRSLHSQRSKWSYLWYIQSVPLLSLHQVVAILASLAMAIGMGTRLVIPLVWFMTLMVCHRMTGLLFGLDQVVMMLSMYLMVSLCGAEWSWDAWWRDRTKRPTSFLFPASRPDSWNTIATRLMQLHLCVVYLFGGVSKLRGDMWWDGSALWFAAASYEYQSLDLTWIGRYPTMTAFLTHITLFWETFYIATVWPKATRPWTLAMALMVHLGIAMFLGMITFGSMMIVANAAFIDPETTRRTSQVVRRWLGRSSSNTELQSGQDRR